MITTPHKHVSLASRLASPVSIAPTAQPVMRTATELSIILGITPTLSTTSVLASINTMIWVVQTYAALVISHVLTAVLRRSTTASIAVQMHNEPSSPVKSAHATMATTILMLHRPVPSAILAV
jgi:hypothetical protein